MAMMRNFVWADLGGAFSLLLMLITIGFLINLADAKDRQACAIAGMEWIDGDCVKGETK